VEAQDDDIFIKPTCDGISRNMLYQKIFNALYRIKDKEFPDDYDDDLLPNNMAICTKGQFAEQLIHWFISSETTMLDRVGLLDILKTNIPTINIPIVITRNDNIVSKLDQYIRFKIPVLEFDVCRNGCICYSSGKDNEILTSCTKCNESRYKPCNIDKCKNDTSVNASSKCTHKRNPYQVISYRPITAIILNLLHYPSFRKLIEFSYSDIFNDNDIYSTLDITTSKLYKTNMDQMKNNFNEYKSKAENINKNIVPINICIAQNYDG
jgi:hypothetical protein